MYHEQSTFDWRRYGHWETSAHKAWLCAFLLWQAHQPEKLATLVRDANYGAGDGGLAMWEGFRRESAVALELIVKAIIAKQLQLRHAPPPERVPATHDIPALWVQAGLPELEREDQYRLLLFKSVLMWSGRYATPRSAKAWAEENRALDALDPARRNGRLVIRRPISFGWEEFDRLYQMAEARLLTLTSEGIAGVDARGMEA